MNTKRLISVSLFIFIAISISFLVYKEFSQKDEKINTLLETETHNTLSIQKSTPINNKVVKEIIPEPQKAVTPLQPTPQTTNSKVIAYYFHGTHRCPTCLTIERYSHEAIENFFSNELRDRKLEFKPLNVEESENRHYIQNYQLYTRSLVIALYKNDKQVKWKNLTDIRMD